MAFRARWPIKSGPSSGLARGQNRLTYNDIDEVLSENASPEDMDEVFAKLRSLDVEVVGPGGC